MIPEILQIRIALANLEPQLTEVINNASNLKLQYSLLQAAYTSVCNERDSLKQEIEKLKRENDKCNIDNKES